MKKSFAGMIKPTGNMDKDMREVFLFLQKLGDDVSKIIGRGLNLTENQQIVAVTQRVVSGAVTELNSPAFVVRGAIIVETDGAMLKGYSVKALKKGSVEVVCDLDRDQADIKFLLIGE